MIKNILLFLLLSISIFAFEINDIEFDKEVKKGETTNKTFTIYNTKNSPVTYNLSIEGDTNVQVSPKTIVINPESSEQFNIHVNAKKKSGEYHYYFVAKEVNKNQTISNNSLQFIKTIKILQSYKIN